MVRKSLLVLSVLALLGVGPALAAAPDTSITRYGAAELRYDQGIPILRVAGDSYEMGFQYGTLLKSELNAIVADFDGLAERVKANRPWYQRALAPLWITWFTREFGDRLPQAYREEIRGMAEASGIEYRKLLFIALGAGFSDTSNCTGALVRLGDRILLGRNFDWAPMFLARHPLIVEYRPKGELAFTNFGFVGVPGVVQGVNSAGLALTTNIAFGLYRDTPANKGMLIVFKNRAVLEQAASLNQAERIYRSFATDEAGWMITLASAAEKDGAIIEMFDNHFARSGLTDGKAHVHNILFDPARLGSNELARQYTELKMALDEYNVRREAETQKRFNAVTSVDSLLDYLGDTNFYGYERVILTHCGAICNDYTINTLVFDPARQTVYYAVAPGFSALSPVYRYDLASRRLTPYRAANERFNDPRRQARMRWFDAYLNLKYCGDDAGIQTLVNLDEAELDPVQLRYAADAWLAAPVKNYGQALLAALERESAAYPRYGMLYLYRAKVLERLGHKDEALQTLDKLGVSSDLTPDFELEALLMRCRLAEGQAAKAAQAAYIDRIEALQTRWRVEDRYLKPYLKMSSALKP